MDPSRRASHFLEWRKRQVSPVDGFLSDECAQWGSLEEEDEFSDIKMIEITEEWGYDERKRTRRRKGVGKG